MQSWLDAGEADGSALRYTPVTLSRVPESVRRAVIVSEDAAFFGHRGFDWHEVRQAVRDAWRERRPPRGASTITQQLARNLFLSPSRNPVRKLREALIARRLEAALSKDRILELYLSVIEFGPGLYGVEAASRRYFGVGVSGVSPRQAAELAATIPSPRRHNPATRTREFQRRVDLAFRRAIGVDVPARPPSLDSLVPVLPDSAGTPEIESTTASATDSLPES
jgi:monofunctional biosynthetic peptidoglycan transglycosylase